MYWYDGQFFDRDDITLSIRDPGLIFGATTFTTLRVVGGNLHDPATPWAAHRDRLARSIAELHWQPPPWPRLETEAADLATRLPVLRIVLFPDGREWVAGRPLPPDRRDRQTQGIVAWLASAAKYRRAIATQKTGNYLPSWLALTDARHHGAAEAILLDADGHWLETSTGNLWGYQGGHWHTPALGNLLPGIARQTLLTTLRSRGEPVTECPWSPKLVERFEAIAYSNSVYGVVPIRAILGPDGTPHRNDLPTASDAIAHLQHAIGHE